MTKSLIYGVWKNMRYRCQNKNHKYYSHYGGRGIKVCERWSKFENFLYDMGNKPKDRSLDRIDNDGNYCKENCRWANTYEQAINRRTIISIEYNGITKNIKEWSVYLGINYQTLHARIYRYKWDINRAFIK